MFLNFFPSVFFLSIDHRNSTAGATTISLLAVGISSGKVWIFDFYNMHAKSASHYWDTLKPRFKNQDIYKCVYNGSWLGPPLLRQAGVSLKSVWDVQVAHSLVEIIRGTGGETRGWGAKQSLDTIFKVRRGIGIIYIYNAIVLQIYKISVAEEFLLAGHDMGI